MPRLRLVPDVEIEAMYRYLATVPAVRHRVPAGEPARRRVTPTTAPERAFSDLGCVARHGSTTFRDRLVRARGRDVCDVATFIRNPERTYPRTEMPTYADLIDDAQGLRLAQWVLQGPANERE